MSFAYDVHWKDPDGFKNLIKTHIDESFKSDVVSHDEKLSGTTSFSKLTKVARWTNNTQTNPWISVPGFVNPISCNLLNYNTELLEELKKYQVVLLSAETGAGKSVIIPGLLYQFINENYTQSTDSFKFHRFRGIHMVPTGEQTLQNAAFIRDRLYQACKMKVDSWCSRLNPRGGIEGTLDVQTTDYCYCTPFFAIQALESNDTYFHVVVLDEIHELCPTTIYLLHLIRNKLLNGTIFRVFLLSATTSTYLKDMLERYISPKASFHSVSFGQSPYPTVVMMPKQDAYSSEALSISDPGLTDSEIYSAEADLDNDQFITPNLERLRKRAVQYAISLCKRFLRTITKTSTDCHGCLVFLAGAADTVIATHEFNTEILQRFTAEERTHIKVYTVNGDHRDDISDLSQAGDPQIIRVAFTTPLLETGVTLHGLDVVIDTGTHKYTKNRNLQNIMELRCAFIDDSSRKQRKGRVGRLTRGEYYPCYSKDRYDEMTEADSLLPTLLSKYTSADLVPILNIKHIPFLPTEAIFHSLMLESGLEGFLYRDPTTLDPNPYSRKNLPVIDVIGSAIFRCFPGLSLDLGLFLLNCATNGCLLSGLIYVACCQNRHSGVKKPIKSTDVGQPGRNRYGRDDDMLHWNLWKVLIPTNGSFLLKYCEMMLNLWMFKYGYSFPGSTFNKPYIDSKILNQMNEHGIMEIHRAICGLANGLVSIGAITSLSSIFSHQLSGLERKFHYSTEGTSTIVQLIPERQTCFSAALITSFGSRVLYVAREQRTPVHTTFEVLADVLPGNKHHYVQGEQVDKYDPSTLAVYNNIFKKDNEERFLTGIFQPTTPLEFLIMENAYGLKTDRIDAKKLSLTIFTLTGTFSFYFKEWELLQLIVNIRGYMKCCPSAILVNTNFAKKLASLVNNNWNDFITVTPNPDLYVPRPYVFYKQLFPHLQNFP